MSKNIKKLQLATKALLEDINQKIAKPEGEPNDPFGQYFGAPQRLDVPSPREPNTNQEELLLNAIKRHISFNENTLDDYGELLKKLKVHGKYRKFLNPIPGTVYRFIQVTRQKAMEILGIDEMEPNKIVVQNKSGVLKPTRREAQSWTYAYSQEVFEYVRDGGRHDNVLIGFISDTTKGDFYFNWQELAKHNLPTLEAVNLLKKEKEVISFGPVAYTKAFYFWQDRTIIRNTNENVILKRFNNVSKKSVQQTSEKILELLIETQKVAKQFDDVVTKLDPNHFDYRHLFNSKGNLLYFLSFAEDSLMKTKTDYGWNFILNPNNPNATNALYLNQAIQFIFKATKEGVWGFAQTEQIPENLNSIEQHLRSLMNKAEELSMLVVETSEKDKKLLMKIEPSYWDTTQLRKASRKSIK